MMGEMNMASHLGDKCNSTIYISNISRGDIVTGLESVRKEGTIIRTGTISEL